VLFIGAGYHADPVWWNTQRDYTDIGSHQKLDTASFLRLNRAYLELLKEDPDFRCTLETVDALQPTWFSEPEFRNLITQFAGEGRLELIGSYDEPQTTLVGCELLCRNLAYGIGFARKISGINPKGTAQWDVFGHDPVWPALGEKAGLEWTTFCRGLYHDGNLPPEENLIPSEFRWISPDGTGHLTHYQSRHYTSGWEFPWTPPDAAEIPVLDRFDALTVPATTHNVLLPCYGDFAMPFDGMMEFVRWWNDRYISPRIIPGTQDDYLKAVKVALAKSEVWLPPISRDLNPCLSGCNLSYADTKQAQRIAENVIRDAEIWSTIAWLNGARYPRAALDRAWRILCHTAHHDAVSGSESDQVYLDLTSLWREAHDLANEVRRMAISALSASINPSTSQGDTVVTVFNSTTGERDSSVRVESELLQSNGPFVAVDSDGEESCLMPDRNGFAFKCRKVPPLGWKNYKISGTKTQPLKFSLSEPAKIENEYFEVTVDPSRGGGITGIKCRGTGREFLRNGKIGNDIVVYPEYPGLELGPWRIQPTGERIFAGNKASEVTCEKSSDTQILASKTEFFGCNVKRKITLRSGDPFVDCSTGILGFSDHDLMWRVEFPLDLPGTRPVAQTSGGVIGRGFGRLGDFLEEEYFGDWAVDTWGGLECPVSFLIPLNDKILRRTSAVGEIIVPDRLKPELYEPLDRLVRVLARAGITTVVTRDGLRRSGDWMKDSSRPDFRIALGNPGSSSYIQRLFDIAAKQVQESTKQRRDFPCWVDIETREPDFNLPVLVIPDRPAQLNALINKWETAVSLPPASLEGIRGSILSRGVEKSDSYTTADAGFDIIVRGTPSMFVLPDGTISLGLFRSSSGCPSGGWIDPDPVRMPDGSFFQHEHWSHRFQYRIMPHTGDWRSAGVAKAAEDFTSPLTAVVTNIAFDSSENKGSFLTMNSGSATLQALRPLDTSDTDFDISAGPPAQSSDVMLRFRELEGGSTEISVLDGDEEIRLVETDLLGDPVPDDEKSGKEDEKKTIGPWSVDTYLASSLKKQDLFKDSANADESLKPTALLPSRYWRSSLGPAGWRSQPVFHRFKEKSLPLQPGSESTATLMAVSSSDIQIYGLMLRLGCMENVSVTPSEYGPFDLEPGQVIEVPVKLNAGESLHANGGFLTAILTDDAGLRTIAAMPVNREPDQPAPVSIEIPEAVIVGDDGINLDAEIRNELEQEIEGMIELILPFEAWPLLESRSVRQKMLLSPGESKTVGFMLKSHGNVMPGRYYAVAKIHCFEEQAYSSACWVVVPDESGTWLNSEQGREAVFGLPDFEISASLYETERPSDKPFIVRTPSGDDLDISSTTREIPGGWVSKIAVRPGPLSAPLSYNNLLISPRLQSLISHVECDVKLPRGPVTSVQRISSSLGLDDSIHEWIKILPSRPQQLGFINAEFQREKSILEIPVWLGYDDHALFFMTEIPWKFKVNPWRKRRIRLGDCLQLAFFPSRIVEIGCALTSDGTYPWTWFVAFESPYPPMADFHIETTDERTVIRSVIPWSLLRMEKPPAVLPWNVVVHRSDGNHEWSGAWVLSDGTVGRKTKDGLEFGLLVRDR
jgi:hypothetical protein